MTPGLFEHVLFAVLVLVMPLWAVRQHRGLLTDILASSPSARIRAYRRTMVVEWALAALVFARWAVIGALPGVLGPGDVGLTRWWIGVGLTLVACLFLAGQTVVILRSARRMEHARRQVEPLRSIIPVTAREGRVFNALSITAGVCEETLYRVFLISYLAAFGPLWFAVVGSSIIFGLGHAYQGTSGILKTGLVGAVMAALLLLTGSLWAPALAHAVLDMSSGYLGRRVLSPRPDSTVLEA